MHATTILSGIFLAAILTPVGAQPHTPNFNDYPTKGSYVANSEKLIFGSKQDREFQGQLRRAAKQRPNFAGHYILTSFGCGASCVMGAIIDAASGRVTWLPFTVCCGNSGQAPVDFRLRSALIVIHGMRNERGPGTFYYTFRHNRLSLIAAVPD